MGWTFVISVALSFVSDRAMGGVSVFVAFFVLLCFIVLGIIFDILGLAIISASEKPFHSMASRRVKGSFEALWLMRRADRVSNFCNDVVGDISGIISGATSAAIVARIVADGGTSAVVAPVIASALVAALTVGGKSLGKTLAIKNSTSIVLFVGRLIYTAKSVFKVPGR